MKNTLILLLLTTLTLFIGSSEANAFATVSAVTAVGGGLTNPCNGVVAFGCYCPPNSGSLTCNPNQFCEVYVWVGWPECIVG